MAGWPKHELLAATAELAMWCTTTGYGLSGQILFGTGTNATQLNLSPQLRSFNLFHVYFTTRRILFGMGSIQSVSALPGEPTFSLTNNHYDIAAYNTICK